MELVKLRNIHSVGWNEIKIDECIFWAFECLGRICVEDGDMRDKTRYEYRKSVSVLDYVVRNWKDKKRKYKKGKSVKDKYVEFRFLDIYELLIDDLKYVCEYSKDGECKKALNKITECRAKLKWAKSKTERNLKYVIDKKDVKSNIKELSNFISGERVSYKLFDVGKEVIEETILGIDDIFEKSILNRGWDDPEVNTGENWELCVCGGGGFFVRREYLKPLDPKLPPGTSIEVEECPACDREAGVRGLREKRHSSKPEKGQNPSYREHINEIFGDGQFHPDML